MRDWWYRLSDRERIMVSGGGIICGILIAYFFIWQPITQQVARAEQNYQAQASLLQWLQGADRRVAVYQAAGADRYQPSQQALLVLIERSLAQEKLSRYLNQVQQTNSNQVALRFNRIPFDQFIGWLQGIVRSHALTVSNINVTRGATTGVVGVSLALSNA